MPESSNMLALLAPLQHIQGIPEPTHRPARKNARAETGPDPHAFCPLNGAERCLGGI
jgi:hypothetical protein